MTNLTNLTNSSNTKNLSQRYMEATPTITRIFTTHEASQLFDHLDHLEFEYHKPYLRFNKPVKVPRGQASFTLNETIHYSYKAAGGSPPNRAMDDTLRTITARVNQSLITNFNTILLNKYKNGDDCIGFHRDSTDGWEPLTGFATLSFGATRDFQLRNESGVTTYIRPRARRRYLLTAPDERPLHARHTQAEACK